MSGEGNLPSVLGDGQPILGISASVLSEGRESLEMADGQRQTRIAVVLAAEEHARCGVRASPFM